MVAIYSLSNQIGMISTRSRLIRKNEFHLAQINNLNKLNGRVSGDSYIPFPTSFHLPEYIVRCNGYAMQPRTLQPHFTQQ
jgi:hypothetical protein